jgi:hypothetical protein
VTTSLSPASHASFHAVQRRLAALIPDGTTVQGGAALELSALAVQEKPRLDPPDVLEGTGIAVHPVEGGPLERCTAFLDGSQSSRVAQYVAGIPIVHATVAAVVRARHQRRLTTWRAPEVERRLYAPLALLPPSARSALDDSGTDVFDTTARRDLDSIHPFALQDAALQAVQRHRSALERRLAEAWCASEEGLLLVDGGISESALVARSPFVVGVVKSHQQLYVHGDDLATILGLRGGERSSVVRIAPRDRTPVASWYLRLRSEASRDPLWGLVRVELCEPQGASQTQIASLANDASRWLLAESLPLALPDGRWDKMVYGIRDCEEFLRAIQ